MAASLVAQERGMKMNTREVPIILSDYDGDEIENLLAAIAGDGESELR